MPEPLRLFAYLVVFVVLVIVVLDLVGKVHG